MYISIKYPFIFSFKCLHDVPRMLIRSIIVKTITFYSSLITERKYLVVSLIYVETSYEKLSETLCFSLSKVNETRFTIFFYLGTPILEIAWAQSPLYTKYILRMSMLKLVG